MPSSSTSDNFFRAVADPTRRRILDLLAERGPLIVGEISEEFPDLVASGISKHLMGLRAAGLVHASRRGRQQLYRLQGEALAEALVPWLVLYERYWTDALEQLRNWRKVRVGCDLTREHATRCVHRWSNIVGKRAGGLPVLRRGETAWRRSIDA
jgi:DNA-binding transcriptional ArsR family regulator